jgi:hypothetical protein
MGCMDARIPNARKQVLNEQPDPSLCLQLLCNVSPGLPQKSDIV